VTCIQSGMHGKGDFALDSKKTSDSDQWHFVPKRNWLGCMPVDCATFDIQVLRDVVALPPRPPAGMAAAALTRAPWLRRSGGRRSASTRWRRRYASSVAQSRSRGARSKSATGRRVASATASTR
jgi:hypothetical protein